jgi:hypothetical protein
MALNQVDVIRSNIQLSDNTLSYKLHPPIMNIIPLFGKMFIECLYLGYGFIP